MKYAIFISFAMISVPLIAGMTMRSSGMRGWLVALLVFSPMLGDISNINFVSLEWYRGPDRGFEITLSDLIALGLALGLIAGSYSRVSWFPPGSLVMGVFFCFALASSALAPEPLFSLFSLFKMVRVWLFYWTLFNCLKLGTPLEHVFRGLLLMALVITLLCLKQKYLGGLYRVHATFDHSNTIPPYVNLVMPALLLWGLAGGRWKRWWSLAAVGGALGLVFCVLATQSRAGLVFAGICLLLALAAANWRARSRTVGAVSLLVVLGTVAGGIKAADTIATRISSAPKTSAEARDEFNLAASLMARDHFLGIGLNNFSHVLTNREQYRRHIKVMSNEKQAGVAHHIYWLTAAEMGWPGLASLVLMELYFLWKAMVVFLRDRGTEGLLALSLFLGSLSLHLSGFFEWALRISPVTYQFVMVSAMISFMAWRSRETQKAVHAARANS